MPNPNLTHIVLLLDRSGSMASCQKPSEDALNEFLNKQKLGPGECRLTVAMFDDQYERPYNNVPIAEVKRVHLQPRGNTAFFYALCRTVDEVGADLAKLPEHERPGLVEFVVVTDGLENWSSMLTPIYTRQDCLSRIEHQKTTYNWVFTFIGAGIDAEGEGVAIGLSANQTARSPHKAEGYKAAYSHLSNKVFRNREEVTSGGIVSCDSGFTEEERIAIDRGEE